MKRFGVGVAVAARGLILLVEWIKVCVGAQAGLLWRLSGGTVGNTRPEQGEGEQQRESYV